MESIERLSRNIDDFQRDTLNVDHFLTGTLVSYMFFKDRYPDILNEFNEKEKDGEEKQGMEIFKKLNLKISDYEIEIYTFCFINLISRTEAFLNDILETLYLGINDGITEELNKEVRKKTLLKFSHSSFNDKIKFLKNNFNLNFPSIEEHKSNIVELFSTRNIILHNNGYVNATYLKINKDSDFLLGTKRIIDRDYLKFTIVLLILIAKSIEEHTKELIKNASQ